MNKLAYLNVMLKKSIILFENNGFDLSGIKENINLQCRVIRKNWDGYHQQIHDNNFDLNEENNYRYYPNRNIHKIVISSKINNSFRATEVLIHELCHAVQDELHGYDCKPHGKEFKAIASSVGLGVDYGRYTPALPALEAQIENWNREAGTYPHPSSSFEQIENLIINIINYGGCAYLLVLAFQIINSEYSLTFNYIDRLPNVIDFYHMEGWKNFDFFILF
jgi:hypothetical protein